jgi:hypothetical protein
MRARKGSNNNNISLNNAAEVEYMEILLKIIQNVLLV